MPTVLIADDEAVILRLLARFLEKEGRTLLLASTAAEALRLAEERGPVDVALLDKNLGDDSGLEVARELKRRDENVQVVLLTGYASLQSAVEAVQIGAYDYLTKPVEDFEGLDLRISNAAERSRLAREHRSMVAELAESERRNRQILEAMPDALLVFERGSGTIRQVSPAAARIFAADAGSLVGRDVATLFEDGLPDGAPGSGPVTCLRAGGTFPGEVRSAELAWQGRALATFVVRDVSVREQLARERQRAEDELRHAQKMEAVTRLAAGIGHDLANLLAALMTHADALAAEQPGNDDLGAIQTAAERATALVRQMMTLSRRGPSLPVLLTLEGAVGEVAKLLRRTLGERIDLQVVLSPEPCQVRIDAGQVAQVLLNLAVNARDAMPDGGRLTIRTERAAAGPGGAPGDWVALVVSDNGVGMTAEVRQRIFEPFFTTKAEGKGTGLGLAVSHGIVAQAGGAFEVDSAPGRGTTFRILLPRADRRTASVPAVPQPVAAGRVAGRRSVLVVEDDAALLRAVTRALAAAGLEVLEAPSGEAALAVARAKGGPDLLLTDVVMPGLSGEELAVALLREYPAMKLLLMTGFPGDPRVCAAVGRGAPVLEKPFRAQTLVERVRSLVA